MVIKLLESIYPCKFQFAGVYNENTESEFLMEQKGIFSVKSSFSDFGWLSRYRDFQNFKLYRCKAFETHLSMQFPFVGVYSENFEMEVLMEWKGIFFVKSSFSDFRWFSGYRNLQNIKSYWNKTFGTHLSMQFSSAGVYGVNTQGIFNGTKWNFLC